MMAKRKVRLSPPRHVFSDVGQATWLNELYERTGEGPLLVQGYSKDSLPDPKKYGSVSSADSFTSLIFVSDATGGACVAYSDGADWRRVYNSTVIN